MRPGSRGAEGKDKPADVLIAQIERTKANLSATMLPCFEYSSSSSVRWRRAIGGGGKKMAGRIVTLFARDHLWMARHELLRCTG